MTGNYYKDLEYIAPFGVFKGDLLRLNMDNSCLISPNDVKKSAYISGIVGYLTHYSEEKKPTVIQCISKAVINAPSEIVIGGIIGFCIGQQSKIENCINFSDIPIGNYSGGIIGVIASHATVHNCLNYGNITAELYAGGIIAQNSGDISLENCQNHGIVTGNNKSKSHYCSAGGIIGYAAGNHIQVISCINKGNIISVSIAGGIIGQKDAYIQLYDCTNTGNVTAEKRAAGITMGGGGIIDHCSNKGNVKAYCSDYSYLIGNTKKIHAAGIGVGNANCINCSNYGEVSAIAHSVGPQGSSVYVICSGICNAGNAYNCFNRGNLTANCHLEATDNYYASYAILSLSGIIDSGNTNNSYNTGNLIHNYYVKNAGYTSQKCISPISANHQDMPITIENCYYSNESMEYTSNGGSISFTPLSEMQTPEFVRKLNLGKKDLNEYKADSWMLDYNDGTLLPNFTSVITSLPIIDNNETTKEQSLLSQTIVSEYAELNMEIKSNVDIYLYNTNGILINRLTVDNNLIDIRQYADGNYIIVAKGKNFNRSGKLIIKH